MSTRGEGKIRTETRTSRNGKVSTVYAWYMEIGVKPDGSPDRIVIRRKSKAEVVKLRRQTLLKLEQGEVLRKDSTTVEEWLQYWLDEIQKPLLRPLVWRNLRSSISCNITPHVGRHKLHDLEPQHIRFMIKEILKSGRSLRTAEIAYNNLNKAIKDAIKEQKFGLTKNVLTLVTKPKPKSDSQDTGAQKALPTGHGRQQKPRKALLSDTARAVIRTSVEARDPLAVRWAMALLTGVRQGECLGLTLDALDLEEGKFDLSWALQGVPLNRRPDGKRWTGDVYPLEAYDIPAGFEIRPLYKAMCLVRPKTSKSRRMTPIPEPLLLLLRAHVKAMAPNPWGLLFVAPPGQKLVKPGTPMRPNLDEKLWAEALHRAGAPDVVLHSARHTTATLLLEAGVPEDVRMAIMGHSSAAVQRGYAHADIGMKRAGLSRLDDLIDAEVIDVWEGERPALEAAPADVVDAEFEDGDLDDDHADQGKYEVHIKPQPVQQAPVPGDWRFAVFQSA
ncbi:tyrosine-type recombinase/integrase [Nocardia acidivorans]|uniref:tyrosine-type recombinase/integrase n=1 Tax=Nocardia acidivorans TaxID=404580 RepID=UPI00082976EB|nr:tyrosine-type recombinase/integrase [Nocardia acidivorans]